MPEYTNGMIPSDASSVRSIHTWKGRSIKLEELSTGKVNLCVGDIEPTCYTIDKEAFETEALADLLTLIGAVQEVKEEMPQEDMQEGEEEEES